MEPEPQILLPPSDEKARPSGIARRGFASMSKEKRSAVASRGGKTAHKLGRAHVFSFTEAQAAGRKGGKLISQNTQHMSQIGSAGGIARWRREKSAELSPPSTDSSANNCASAPALPADATESIEKR